MEEIEIKELSENFFETISQEWMLITSGTPDQFNTMTASWGGIGFLWNKPIAFVFIRPERYTYEFTEKNAYLTLSFLGMENRDIYTICGTKSGRDIDKIKASGLKPLETPGGNITFEQARLTLECRKLYSQPLNPESFTDRLPLKKWYGEKDGMHKMYILQIEHIWKK